MRRGDTSGTNAQTSQKQFQTPDKPPGPSTVSDGLRGSLSSKKRTGTPASPASTFKSWKRTSFAGARDQPTLTQIDFVTQVSQPQSDDDDLDFIDEAPENGTRRHKEVIEIADDSDNDADYRPPSNSRASRAHGVRFDRDANNVGSKQSRVVSQDAGPSKRGRRKSGDGVKGNKKGKNNQQKDKTLTQMDYVRRYLKIEPDEDVKLEYTYTTPHKHERKSHNLPPPNAEDMARGPNDTYATSSESKRRKLDHELRSNGEVELAKDSKATRLFGGPVTPRKPSRSEIPSSQSPESPGLAIITSSQFRGATRSPLKRESPTPTVKRIKEESPGYDRVNHSPQSLERTLHLDSIPPSMKSHPPPTIKLTSKESLETNASSTQSHSTKGATVTKEGTNTLHELDEHPLTTQRTVVYETDAETDSDDIPDNGLNIPGLPSEEATANQFHTYEDDNKLPNEDSQELPPIPPSGLDFECGPLQLETNLPSDASIYYRRPQQATQFPLEPIPAINTQKMAELFPDHQQEPATASEFRSSPYRPLYTQTQTQSQTQDQDKSSTDIVPESSPIVRCESGNIPNAAIQRGPATRESVVQVESSQPADRFQRKADADGSSQPRGIISKSALLTSSVMESIPLPAFILGSQDSIGEPYSDI
ncbi:hypothetical protein ABOM_000844 [Aspergillus bombycis]|uniref:Uncharacterized protein n=1 Tax=Aspergillus bombycis TaxID=109264 RepID=A0A1F8AGQ1_9EURO|nr:hypothetical protein ABOM_000844 [Aspergillus bombycis]OGM50498.1 hypothetical protein ABOM_000844 [Aspergillus bombycis]